MWLTLRPVLAGVINYICFIMYLEYPHIALEQFNLNYNNTTKQELY